MKNSNQQRIPKVRVARPKSRPYQLRYSRPHEGREIPVSTGTRDEKEMQRQKHELEAKLVLGLQDIKKPRRIAKGPHMRWDDFRDEYSRLKVKTFRAEEAMYTAEIRLDVCGETISPRTIGNAGNAC